MDGVKISEIPRALLIQYEPDNDQNILSEDEIGFNEAISQQGQVRLSLSRENLAIRLFEISYPNLCWEPYKAKNPNSFEGMMLIKADKLIEKQKDLFVVVK